MLLPLCSVSLITDTNIPFLWKRIPLFSVSFITEKFCYLIRFETWISLENVSSLVPSQVKPFCTFTPKDHDSLVSITSYLSSIFVAQKVKCLPSMQETQVWSLGWEDPLEKEMATHSSTLAWKIPWTEEPSRLQSMGSQSGHDWTTSLHFTLCKKHSFLEAHDDWACYHLFFWLTLASIVLTTPIILFGLRNLAFRVLYSQ